MKTKSSSSSYYNKKTKQYNYSHQIALWKIKTTVELKLKTNTALYENK